MATDGSMSVDKRGYYREIIEVKDEQLIKDIATFLKVSYHHRCRVTANKERHLYSVSIPKYVWEDVKECFRKGRVGIFEVYKNSDKNAFIRGMFDGDGTVCEMSNSNKLLRIGISINAQQNEMLEIFKSFCQDNNIKTSLYFDKRGNGAYFISINKKEDILKFFNLIYSNCGIYLKRKYEVFVEHGFPNLVTN